MSELKEAKDVEVKRSEEAMRFSWKIDEVLCGKQKATGLDCKFMENVANKYDNQPVTFH